MTAVVDYVASRGDGEVVDLRTLSNADLDAWRTEAAEAGDLALVAAVDHLEESRLG